MSKYKLENIKGRMLRVTSHHLSPSIPQHNFQEKFSPGLILKDCHKQQIFQGRINYWNVKKHQIKTLQLEGYSCCGRINAGCFAKCSHLSASPPDLPWQYILLHCIMHTSRCSVIQTFKVFFLKKYCGAPGLRISAIGTISFHFRNIFPIKCRNIKI